jgi:uncharacterized protein (TIRG00374 family)
MTEPTQPPGDPPPPTPPDSSPPTPPDGPSVSTGPTAGQDPPHHHRADEQLFEGESVLEVMEEPPGEVPREELVSALSLGARLRRPRTLVSLLLPLILLVLIIVALPGFKFSDLVDDIRQANKALLLAAVIVYYIGFPLRGLRWSILLKGADYDVGPRAATEIIFISWLVNCLVPAKLGDVYRAYLLKINYPVSLSRTFGTVFIERVLDLFAIVILALAAGFVSFRSGMRPEVQIVFLLGVIVAFVLVIGLFTMRNFGRRLITRLPVPRRILELYDRFEEGVFGAVRLRSLPALIVLTGLIWLTEGFRLYLVVEALGFPDVHLGLSGAFFIALAGSLLTAVPITPAGLGIVEVGIAGLLTVLYNVPPTEAAAIILVDRAISVLSIIVLGSIAYVISPMRRGRAVPETAGATPTA